MINKIALHRCLSSSILIQQQSKKMMAQFSSSTIVPKAHSEKKHKFAISKRAKNLEETIWSTYTPLAVANNAVNLGQGFPDWPVDEFVLDALKHQVTQPSHQYAKAHGDPVLVQALQRLCNDSSLSGFKYGKFDSNEILVTNGASDALYIALQALVNPGDEVIIIEPFYDAYKVCIHKTSRDEFIRVLLN